MIVFKILGSTSILIAAAIFCLEAKKYESKKLRQAEGFISLLKHVKKQIECFSKPINDIIMECRPKMILDCGIDIKLINGDQERNLLSALLKSCDFYIDTEAKETLERFADDFGRSYREDQLRSCDYYISELEKYKEKIRGEIPREQRIRLCLCLGLSLSAILLMI